MKQYKIIITTFIITAFTSITSCNETTKVKADNIGKTEQKLITVDVEKKESNIDDEIAYNSFRMETNKILSENEMRIKQLKTKILTQRSDIRRQYEKDIDALREENEKLRSDLNAFTYSTNEGWQQFKTVVEKDINRIGKTLSTQTEKANN